MFYTMFSVDTPGFWEFFFSFSLWWKTFVVAGHFSFHLFIIKAAKFNIQLLLGSHFYSQILLLFLKWFMTIQMRFFDGAIFNRFPLPLYINTGYQNHKSILFINPIRIFKCIFHNAFAKRLFSGGLFTWLNER